MFFATSNAIVTAGLTWQPEICPIDIDKYHEGETERERYCQDARGLAAVVRNG